MIRPLLCPICQKPVESPEAGGASTFPFCSARCRQVDLFRWFEGKYAIVDPLTPETLAELDPEGNLESES